MFTTARCRIRPFREEDLDSFMRYRNDEHWMRYQGFKGLTKEQYRDALLDNSSMDKGMQLAVAGKASDGLIGDLYVQRDGEACWIGCTIAPAYARQGYARESIRGLLDWLTSRQEGVRFFAGVCPDNAASNALMKTMGFRHLRFDPEANENIYSLDPAILPGKSF